MATKTEPRTAWWGWVQGYEDSGRTVSCGSTSVSGRDLAEVIADIFSTAVHRISGGRPFLTVTGLHRHCVACEGSGKVTGRGGHRVRCSACRGKGTFETAADIQIEAPNGIKIVRE